MGISQREITETRKVIEISDAGAWFDEKGKVQTLLSNADEKSDASLAKEALHLGGSRSLLSATPLREGQLQGALNKNKRYHMLRFASDGYHTNTSLSTTTTAFNR